MIFQQGTEGSRIQFRGTISGLAENFSPTYTEIKYSGRAEPVYVYDTFKRDISFNFKVYPTSRAEMKPIWKKLERLSTYTMPDYLSNGYTPGEDGNRELLLTIGYLYEQTPMILTSLTYTYSDETAWDIDYGLPMGIEIQGLDVQSLETTYINMIVKKYFHLIQILEVNNYEKIY